MTRLEAFITEHEIRPVQLALKSGYSRQHILRVRMARIDPTRACMTCIRIACQMLLDRPVEITELFDFDTPPPRLQP